MWRSLIPGKQNGQIRGYQVHYVRVENGESRGLPLIKDVMLADAQVWQSQPSSVQNDEMSLFGSRILLRQKKKNIFILYFPML